MKLYAPPIISAKEKITLGHGVNLVACDVLANICSEKSEPVEYSCPAWNHHGKMMERSGLHHHLEALEARLTPHLSAFGVRNHHLYRDSDSQSERVAAEAFSALRDSGYVVCRDGSYFLDFSRIRQHTPLRRILEEVHCTPDESVRHRLLNLYNTIDGLYPLSKVREFATPIPNDSSTQRINPVFDLSVQPLLHSKKPVDFAIDADRTFLHGVFLPFAIWSSLLGEPFSHHVHLHGYLRTGEGVVTDPLMFSKEHGVDVLRYCVLQASSHIRDSVLAVDGLAKAKKVLRKMHNMGVLLQDQKNAFYDSQISPSVTGRIFAGSFSRLLAEYSNDVLNLSRGLRGGITEASLQEYSNLLATTRVLFPTTFDGIIRAQANL